MNKAIFTDLFISMAYKTITHGAVFDDNELVYSRVIRSPQWGNQGTRIYNNNNNGPNDGPNFTNNNDNFRPGSGGYINNNNINRPSDGPTFTNNNNNGRPGAGGSFYNYNRNY